MRVPLKDNWANTPLSTKVYPLSTQDREVVDATFDALAKDDKLERTRKATPFGFPVFVVWRTARPEGHKVRQRVILPGSSDTRAEGRLIRQQQLDLREERADGERARMSGTNEQP